MGALPPSPFLSAEFYPLSAGAAAAIADAPQLLPAAAVPFEERSKLSAPIEPTMTEGGAQEPRRSLPKERTRAAEDSDFEPDMDALYDAIVPLEPPLFLRSPSQAFMRALFELSR
jgi:hypothetical protein